MDKSAFIELTVKYAKEAGTMSSLLNLQGQVAVVTGGAGSLGFLVANRLAEAGAAIVLSDVDPQRGAYAVEALNSLGRENIRYINADVKSSKEMEEVMEFAVSEFGRLDICVNSAACWSYFTTLDISDEEWKYTIDTVLTGTFNTCQSAARVMRRLGNGGKIIPIGSDASANCEPPLGILNHYSAAKAGVLGFARSFSREVKEYGINVNLVLPGAMHTIGANFLNIKGMENEQTRTKMQSIAMPMSKSPDDVARVVFILCTKVSDFMYGESIFVDGGAHIHLTEPKRVDRFFPHSAKCEA